MAVAGGATTAYTVSMKDGKVKADKTTKLASLCNSPDYAIAALKRDAEATVMGSDMYTFWTLAKAEGLQPYLK